MEYWLSQNCGKKLEFWEYCWDSDFKVRILTKKSPNLRLRYEFWNKAGTCYFKIQTGILRIKRNFGFKVGIQIWFWTLKIRLEFRFKSWNSNLNLGIVNCEKKYEFSLKSEFQLKFWNLDFFKSEFWSLSLKSEFSKEVPTFFLEFLL